MNPTRRLTIALMGLCALLLALSGCANAPAAGRASQDKFIRAVLSQYGQVDLRIMQIPTASNAIANGILSASLKASCDSEAVTTLRHQLGGTTPLHLSVFADHAQVRAATLTCALRTAKVGARHFVYVEESFPDADALRPLAEGAGVEVRWVKLL